MASVAILTARLAKRQAELILAEETYESLLVKSQRSYTFSSGEGSQTVLRQSLGDLQKQISWLESEIEKIEAQLNGGRVARFITDRWA